MQTTTAHNRLMTPPTDDVFGFYGTITTNENLPQAAADTAWIYGIAIITEVSGGNAVLARNFLRHRYGRHFADSAAAYDGPLTERLKQASGEDWVASALRRLHVAGFADTLFAGDPAA